MNVIRWYWLSQAEWKSKSFKVKNTHTLHWYNSQWFIRYKDPIKNEHLLRTGRELMLVIEGSGYNTRLMPLIFVFILSVFNTYVLPYNHWNLRSNIYYYWTTVHVYKESIFLLKSLLFFLCVCLIKIYCLLNPGKTLELPQNIQDIHKRCFFLSKRTAMLF